MPPYSRVRGRTYHVRGSPSSLAYVGDDALYLVDPGHGGGKIKSLTRLLRDLGAQSAVAVITHYHSDHLEAVARRPSLYSRVIATSRDRPGVEDPLIRVAMTFGYPVPPDSPFLPFRAPPVRVDETIDPGESVGPLRTVPLPGHTPGQIGVITPDRVLYAADAVFGEMVLKRYPLPYHLDPCTALESLERIRREDWDILVPGHGPVLEREEALALIGENEEAVRRLLESVEEIAGEGASSEEITRRLVAGRAPDSPGMYMLLEQTVRGALSCLARQGRVEPRAGPEGLAWHSREPQ